MEQTDAQGRLTLHFVCWQNGTSVRLNGTPPALRAPDAYNATIFAVKVNT